jgi:hypothetical protein
MTDYREILRLSSLGINHSRIAESTAISRPTVITVLQRAAAQGLDWRGAEGLSDKELAFRLFPQGEGAPVYTMPDYDWVHREMSKPGVTLQLLWMEYSDKCRNEGLLPYQFTQFKKYHRDYVLKTKATMHIQRKPGEIMEVDWAGQTAHVVSTDTGEALDAYVFVAALPYSSYAYAEAFWSQDQEAWSAAHVNAFTFFGGVARILVPEPGAAKNRRDEKHPGGTRAQQELSGAGGALRHGDHPGTGARAEGQGHGRRHGGDGLHVHPGGNSQSDVFQPARAQRGHPGAPAPVEPQAFPEEGR